MPQPVEIGLGVGAGTGVAVGVGAGVGEDEDEGDFPPPPQDAETHTNTTTASRPTKRDPLTLIAPPWIRNNPSEHDRIASDRGTVNNVIDLSVEGSRSGSNASQVMANAPWAPHPATGALLSKYTSLLLAPVLGLVLLLDAVRRHRAGEERALRQRGLEALALLFLVLVFLFTYSLRTSSAPRRAVPGASAAA